MAAQKEETKLNWWEKLIALAIVVVLVLLVFLVPGWLGFKGESKSGPDFSGCDTLRNPTPCPEPDYDEPIDDLKNEPY